MAYIFEEACVRVLGAGVIGGLLFTAVCLVLIGRETLGMGVAWASRLGATVTRGGQSSIPVYEQLTIRNQTLTEGTFARQASVLPHGAQQ